MRHMQPTLRTAIVLVVLGGWSASAFAQPADPAVAEEITLDDLLAGMSDEEVDRFLELAAQARLKMERQKVAGEIEGGLLYDPADVDKALGILRDDPADTQADNIDRICRAMAAVDPVFAKPYRLHREDQHEQAVVEARKIRNIHQATYLSAATHYLYADALAKAGQAWEAVYAFNDLLTRMPERVSFASEAAVRMAETYEQMGRKYYALQMYEQTLLNYGLTIDAASAERIARKVAELNLIYADPMKAVAHRMETVGERLASLDSGEQTQQTGAEAVAILTDLVKTLEEQQQGQQGQSSSSQQQNQQEQQEGQQGGQQEGQQAGRQQGNQNQPNASNPASKSYLGGGEARTFTTASQERSGARGEGDWADLPPRERERLEQISKQILSERNRNIIRDYHTKLAETE